MCHTVASSVTKRNGYVGRGGKDRGVEWPMHCGTGEVTAGQM